VWNEIGGPFIGELSVLHDFCVGKKLPESRDVGAYAEYEQSAQSAGVAPQERPPGLAIGEQRDDPRFRQCRGDLDWVSRRL
jgi:hypothetical protein